MGRTCKTYYVESLNNYFTLKELEKVSGIPKRVIYERIHKYNWNIESAIKTPKKSTSKIDVKIKTNTVTTNNTTNTTNNSYKYSDKEMSENIDNFLFKGTTNICSLDYVSYCDLDYNPCIIKLIDTSDKKTKAKGVTPFNSHPHRYAKAWPMFKILVDLAKAWGGYLYVINYDSKDDSEYKIIKIKDYIIDKISEIVTYDHESYPYLIYESKNLNKEEFNDWVIKFNEINRQYKNNEYKALKKSIKKSNGLPLYYKEPKPSTDHLGNKYDSFNKMCKAYNMNSTTVRQRLNNGWSIERALTETPKKRNRRA